VFGLRLGSVSTARAGVSDFCWLLGFSALVLAAESKDSSFSSSHGTLVVVLSIMPTRCSLKCLRGRPGCREGLLLSFSLQ
jgi:hypothetical protein